MTETLFRGILKPQSSGVNERETMWLDSFSEKLSSSPSILECTNCSSSDNWDETDVIVCRTCGNVQQRTIDSGAEYRYFGYDDRSGVDPCRVGAPTDPRFSSSTLGTIILGNGRGGANTGKTMARIRRYHTWNMITYRERSLLKVFEQLALVATNHGINGRAIDTAKELYIQLVEHCDRRGMARNNVVACSIYSALKMVGEPRKPREISDIFHLTTAQFTSSFKYFQEVLAIAKQRGQIQFQHTPASLASTRASDYLRNPLSKLPLSRADAMEIEAKAIRVSEKAESMFVSPENMPPSLAAGVIAFVLFRTGYKDISLARIAGACNVSEGTLTKCLRKLESCQEDLQSVM
jgi:transcription initiation factor TFIIIB Brf1 subunit/transcription initiation factor TFIIB